MKIGIDCRFFSTKFTGIGRYTHELVDFLIQQNKKLTHPHEIVLFFNHPEYKEFKSPDEKIRKVLVGARHYSLAEQTKFLKILNKEKCDLVHFTHFNLPMLYRRPYIVTIHDLTLSFFPGQKMNKWYHRLAYQIVIRRAAKKSRRIIAVSQNTKSDIVDQLKIPADKIAVIHNGVSSEFKLQTDTASIEKTLAKYKINKNFLLYTGVWRSHKNLVNLIKAFHALKNERNIDLQLVITGKTDSHYPEVKNTIDHYQLRDHVILPGLVESDELVHLYNAAFIYVFPSLYEGFGLPPLESMMCGTPVAASNKSSIPEVCGQDNALFFDPYDPDDIADKIEMIFRNPTLQADLIDRGMQHAKKFTWQKTHQQTAELYRHGI